MKVKLLSHTPEPEKLIAIAARLCYSNKANIETIQEEFSEEEIKKFIEQLIETKHGSVTEHAVFSFGIERFSRAVLAEFTRHRICSFSVRSQRYCAEGECEFIYPNGYKTNNKAEEIFESSLANSKQDYKDLLGQNVPKEIARYVLPNATATRMIVTMNARELMHFFNLRCCNRAMKEIRDIANEMLRLVKPIAPNLFKNAGASCATLGYCPEGSRCCGKAPTLNKLKEAYSIVTSEMV